MKPFLALAALLALPLAGHAQTVIYDDSFNFPNNNLNGLTVTTTVNNPSPGDAAHVGIFVQAPAHGDYNYGFTNNDQEGYIVIDLGGPNSGGGHDEVSTYQAATFSSSNVGSTFQAFTTYTLTYNAADGGVSSVTDQFLAGGTAVGGTATGTGGSGGAFAPGATLTFDTGDPLNLAAVNQAIGFTLTDGGMVEYDRNAGLDDFVITATADAIPAVPEPGSWALLAAGFALVIALRQRASQRA